MSAHGEPRACGALAPFLAAVVSILFAITMVGCSASEDSDLGPDDAAEAGEELLPAPKANVEINYHRKADTLSRTTVTKFFGAAVIASKPRDASHSEAIVRFDGGVPIWEFKADHGLVSQVSTLGKSSKYVIKGIEYGKLPAHFEQVIPDEGPPEPLDRGAFYIFEVERASGSTSYQAVKVQADGSLVAYNAQPRAGNSYLLCCNVDADFPEPVVLPDTSVDHGIGGGEDQMSPDSSSPDSPPP